MIYIAPGWNTYCAQTRKFKGHKLKKTEKNCCIHIYLPLPLFFSPPHLSSFHLPSPPYLTPGPPCSLLTSCSSWSCCYLKPRLVARVETPARSTMTGYPPRLPLCCPHQLVPSWSPAWLRPSRVSSWVGWACSRSLTLGVECRCPGTFWIFTASTSSSSIYWKTLPLASPATTSSRPTPYAAFTILVRFLAHRDPMLWNFPSTFWIVTVGEWAKTLYLFQGSCSYILLKSLISHWWFIKLQFMAVADVTHYLIINKIHLCVLGYVVTILTKQS